MLGGATTVSVAVASAAFERPWAVVSAPTGNVLVYDPAEAEVTLTVTVQLPFNGIVPPLRATVLPPATAVTVPPAQVVAALGGVAFTSPTG